MLAGELREADGAGGRADEEILRLEILRDRGGDCGRDGGCLGGLGGGEGAAVQRRFVKRQEEAPLAVARGEGAGGVGALGGEKRAHRLQRRRSRGRDVGGEGFGGGRGGRRHGRRGSSVPAVDDDYSVRKAQVRGVGWG